MRDTDIEYLHWQGHRDQLLAEAEADRQARRLRRPRRLRVALGALLIVLGRLLIRLGERLRGEPRPAPVET